MKIGILTLPLHTNYGGILQAYALQTVLERMGHETYLIEERQKSLQLPLWKASFTYCKRIAKNILGHPFPVFYEQKVNHETPIIRQNTNKFIRKYIKRKVVEDYSDIQEKDFDAFVVGSDQVWRPKYFQEIEHAYLDFTEGWNVKRIAYAVSFGTDKWEYTLKQSVNCKELIELFDAVSVRESSGVALCREHFDIKAEHVLDPTMLLSKENYIHLFENAGTQKCRGSLLNYILDVTPEKTSLIEKIAKDKGLQPFQVNAVNDIKQPVEKRIAPSVEQWLRGFHDAEFVVTDSFHACVFSILFNKPFIAIGNTQRGLSRFKSLLAMFGLTDRLTTDISEPTCMEIDWRSLNRIMDKKREQSIKILTDNLKN